MATFVDRVLATGSLIMALLVFGGGADSMKSGAETIFRVGYPLDVFRKDETLLDPANLYTTYEYNLLENLAVGLLRDDFSAPSGYRSTLAEEWDQPDPTIWRFRLRRDNRWSDGTPISPDYIVQHIRKLATSNSRHLSIVKTIRDVAYDEKSRFVSIVFGQSVGNSVLHELSLSDAVLLHPDNQTKSWRITSGPYRVVSYDPVGGSLTLEANPFCPLLHKEAPKKLELVRAQAGTVQDFRKAGLNLIGIPSFQPSAKLLIETASKIMQGFPSTIFFFEFCSKQSKEDRLEFAEIVGKAFRAVHLEESTELENQLFPFGYPGRLKHYPAKTTRRRVLSGKRLKIGLLPTFFERTDIKAALVAAAAEHQVQLEFSTVPYEAKEPSVFAKVSAFRGNQQDPLGSWSFLFSNGAPLARFRDEVGHLCSRALSAVSDSERVRAFEKLHRRVLDETYLVPFAVTRPRLATSADVDLSRFNPFDMRYRFYDVIWKP